MKKGLLLSALCALLAIGCSQQPESGGDPRKPGTVRFVITAGTPATRVLYSEETINPVIVDVSVYVYLLNETTEEYEYLKTIPISGWTNAGVTLTLENENVLVPGDYKFIAVGYAETGPGERGWMVSATSTFDSAYLYGGNYPVSDVYAGNAAMNITSDGATVEIDMTRKVAGLLAYFKNIPETEGAFYIEVRIKEYANTSINLIDGTGLSPGSIDRVNKTPISIYIDRAAVDGIYPGNDIPDDGIEQLPNSYLTGNFVVPGEEVVFTVCLCEGKSGLVIVEPLKEWTVNGGKPITIEANRLYTIGRKRQAANTNGGTPEDDTDDDLAIDLSATNQDLVISVSPEWDEVVPIDPQRN